MGKYRISSFSLKLIKKAPSIWENITLYECFVSFVFFMYTCSFCMNESSVLIWRQNNWRIFLFSSFGDNLVHPHSSCDWKYFFCQAHSRYNYTDYLTCVKAEQVHHKLTWLFHTSISPHLIFQFLTSYYILSIEKHSDSYFFLPFINFFIVPSDTSL